jgi:ATP phosphoribosyltransferase regulatory subunit
LEYKGARLKPDESAALELRGIYERYGYKKYKPGRFEEYSLYADNVDFFGGDKVITFTELDGRLLALKPDVTLSIIKNTRASRANGEKLYYIENVYRESKESHTYKEISQLGLEMLGDVSIDGVAEVVSLAAISLETISPDFILEISHMDFVLELLNSLGVSDSVRRALIRHIGNKNADGVRKTCEKAGAEKDKIETICLLPSLCGEAEETLRKASEIAINDTMRNAVDEICRVLDILKGSGNAGSIRVDFSIVNNIEYYNGIIIRGYVRQLGKNVLAGGQYDRAMKKFGKDIGAMGFALYLNELSAIGGAPDAGEPPRDEMLSIALPKGRLGDKVYEMLDRIGYGCPGFDDQSRKLIFENREKKVRYLLVKPSDAAIYVEHQAADAGVVGKDILLETSPDVYELMDLKIGKCNMATAAPRGYIEDTDRPLKVATKYANIAKGFYAEQNREIDLIKLNGSVELAPILGLSDVIVDIVETGNTLRENDLTVLEEFRQISARFITNKSSFKFKNDIISDILEKLEEVVR